MGAHPCPSMPPSQTHTLELVAENAASRVEGTDSRCKGLETSKHMTGLGIGSSWVGLEGRRCWQGAAVDTVVASLTSISFW